jgi:hypothetical protein
MEERSPAACPTAPLHLSASGLATPWPGLVAGRPLPHASPAEAVHKYINARAGQTSRPYCLELQGNISLTLPPPFAPAHPHQRAPAAPCNVIP